MDITSALDSSTQSALNGSGQFTLLSLLLALVAYIRNIPIPLLLKNEKKYLEKIKTKQDRSPGELCNFWWIHLQLIGLNLLQIFLVYLALVITNNFMIYSQNHQIQPESSIAISLFFLALILFFYHLITNTRYTLKSCNALKIYLSIMNNGIDEKVNSYVNERLQKDNEEIVLLKKLLERLDK